VNSPPAVAFDWQNHDHALWTLGLLKEVKPHIQQIKGDAGASRVN
jgi:hypothetical protein